MKNPNTRLYIALALTGIIQASPAFAATGFDFETGSTTLANVIIGVIASFILVASAIKGYQAVEDHRSIGPTLLGLVFGIGLCFGGAYFVNKMGGTGGAVALGGI